MAPPQLLFLRFLLLFTPFHLVSGIGINFGTLGNNLLQPKVVAQLLQSTLFDTVKIYDTNPEILDAFSNTGIDLVVAVENYRVANFSSSTTAADEWVFDRILPATSVSAIVVGNEYLTTDPYRADPNALVRAIQNVHSVLKQRGLHRKIKVSTPHGMALLATSFPPSSSSFPITLLPTITDILTFLATNNAPFMVKAYPYFAYRSNPGAINLQYVLSVMVLLVAIIVVESAITARIRSSCIPACWMRRSTRSGPPSLP